MQEITGKAQTTNHGKVLDKYVLEDDGYVPVGQKVSLVGEPNEGTFVVHECHVHQLACERCYLSFPDDGPQALTCLCGARYVRGDYGYVLDGYTTPPTVNTTVWLEEHPIDLGVCHICGGDIGSPSIDRPMGARNSKTGLDGNYWKGECCGVAHEQHIQETHTRCEEPECHCQLVQHVDSVDEIMLEVELNLEGELYTYDLGKVTNKDLNRPLVAYGLQKSRSFTTARNVEPTEPLEELVDQQSEELFPSEELVDSRKQNPLASLLDQKEREWLEESVSRLALDPNSDMIGALDEHFDSYVEVLSDDGDPIYQVTRPLVTVQLRLRPVEDEQLIEYKIIAENYTSDWTGSSRLRQGFKAPFEAIDETLNELFGGW